MALCRTTGLVAFGVLASCLGASGCAKSTSGAVSSTPKTSSATVSPAASAPLDASVSWRYEVTFDGTSELAVEANFASGGKEWAADESSEPYFRAVEYASGSSWLAAPHQNGSWLVPCTTGCRVRYHFALAEAAHALQDIDEAIASGQALLAPPSTWLLHPSTENVRGDFEMHVNAGPNGHFVTAFQPVRDRPDTYRASPQTLDDASFSAFGALQVAEVPAGDTTVLLGVAPDRLGLTDAEARDWIATSAGAIASYYGGHLPARHTLVLLMKGTGDNTRGETLGGGGPAVLVRASELVNPKTTHDDWVVTHELFHANFPDLGRNHAWLSEGLATYLEPVARARVGIVSREKFWRDLIDGLPQGLPEAGDQGLEHTRTWGRTYWGGALFCLVVDVTLREKTGNRHSLDDVLLAIGKTGATDDAFWDIQQVLDVGARATGTTVVQQLYDELAQKPGNVDLSNLFARLGVHTKGDSVVFDDSAPLAKIRASITARNPG